jgi:hypothetical protein
MKKIFKLFIYFLIFILFTLILLPKNSIYNLLEQELSKQNIIISDEKRDEKLLNLKVSDAIVYYQGIEGANINSINFFSLLLYSEIEVDDVKLLQSLSSFFPPYVKNIILKHSVLDYRNIDIYSEGDFGVLNGNIDLIKRTLILNLEASNKMKKQYTRVLKQMKLEEGKYVYEYRF